MRLIVRTRTRMAFLSVLLCSQTSISHTVRDSSVEEARAAAWLNRSRRTSADSSPGLHRRTLGRFSVAALQTSAFRPEPTITMNLRDAYRDINLLFRGASELPDG